jgi:hypothetical protein
MKKQFLENLEIPDANHAMLRNAIYMADSSQKFILPDGGRLYDDKELKCLDETQPIRLPFPIIALEYSRNAPLPTENQSTEAKCSKAIIFAREFNNDGKDVILITAVNWADMYGLWLPFPNVAIPSVGYLDRSRVSATGRVTIKVIQNGIIPAEDTMDEIGALLCFLNILTCKNVSIEKMHHGKEGKKVKSALPFDSYHVLSIAADGGTSTPGVGASREGRSPREHLRRGHIRRLQDGRRIWVNATVVAAGRGNGIVSKDYTVST